MKKKNYETSVFKSKTFIGAICIAIAILVGFVLVPVVDSAANASVSIIRARQNIPAGTQITAAMLETVKLGKSNLPTGAATKISDITGKYAAVDITQDDILTPAKTAASGGIFNLSDGQYLISITVRNFADGLSGKLQSGDIVSVFIPKDTSKNNQAAAQNNETISMPPELRYVKVAAVTAASGKDTDANQLQTAKSSGATANSDNLPSTVTLLVNETQAQKLSDLDKSEIHLALVCRANSTKAKALLDAQNAYFKNGQTAASSVISSSSDSSASSAPAQSSNTNGVQMSSSAPVTASKAPTPQAIQGGASSK